MSDETFKQFYDVINNKINEINKQLNTNIDSGAKSMYLSNLNAIKIQYDKVNTNIFELKTIIEKLDDLARKVHESNKPVISVVNTITEHEPYHQPPPRSLPLFTPISPPSSRRSSISSTLETITPMSLSTLSSTRSSSVSSTPSFSSTSSIKITQPISPPISPTKMPPKTPPILSTKTPPISPPISPTQQADLKMTGKPQPIQRSINQSQLDTEFDNKILQLKEYNNKTIQDSINVILSNLKNPFDQNLKDHYLTVKNYLVELNNTAFDYIKKSINKTQASRNLHKIESSVLREYNNKYNDANLNYTIQLGTEIRENLANYAVIKTNFTDMCVNPLETNDTTYHEQFKLLYDMNMSYGELEIQLLKMGLEIILLNSDHNINYDKQCSEYKKQVDRIYAEIEKKNNEIDTQLENCRKKYKTIKPEQKKQSEIKINTESVSNLKHEVLVVCSSDNPDKKPISDYNKPENQEMLSLLSNNNYNPTFLNAINGGEKFPDGLINTKDRHYDIILFAGCNLLSWIFADRNSSIQQLLRVLKDTGRVIFVESIGYIIKDKINITKNKYSGLTISIDSMKYAFDMGNNVYAHKSFYDYFYAYFDVSINNGYITYIKKTPLSTHQEKITPKNNISNLSNISDEKLITYNKFREELAQKNEQKELLEKFLKEKINNKINIENPKVPIYTNSVLNYTSMFLLVRRYKTEIIEILTKYTEFFLDWDNDDAFDNFFAYSHNYIGFINNFNSEANKKILKLKNDELNPCIRESKILRQTIDNELKYTDFYNSDFLVIKIEEKLKESDKFFKLNKLILNTELELDLINDTIIDEQLREKYEEYTKKFTLLSNNSELEKKELEEISNTINELKENYNTEQTNQTQDNNVINTSKTQPAKPQQAKPQLVETKSNTKYTIEKINKPKRKPQAGYANTCYIAASISLLEAPLIYDGISLFNENVNFYNNITPDLKQAMDDNIGTLYDRGMAKLQEIAMDKGLLSNVGLGSMGDTSEVLLHNIITNGNSDKNENDLNLTNGNLHIIDKKKYSIDDLDSKNPLESEYLTNDTINNVITNKLIPKIHKSLYEAFNFTDKVADSITINRFVKNNNNTWVNAEPAALRTLTNKFIQDFNIEFKEIKKIINKSLMDAARNFNPTNPVKITKKDDTYYADKFEYFDKPLMEKYPDEFKYQILRSEHRSIFVFNSNYLIFNVTRTGPNRTKLIDPLIMPLDFKYTNPVIPNINNNTDTNTYELISFTYHVNDAGINVGHYEAYVKNPNQKNPEWWYCSDYTVQPVGVNEINKYKDTGTVYLYRNTRLNDIPKKLNSYGGSDTMIQSVMGGCGFLGMAIFQSYVPITLIICIMILLYIIHVIKTNKDMNPNNLITYDNPNNMLTYDNSNNLITYST